MAEAKGAVIISQYYTNCQDLSEISLKCTIDNKNNPEICQEHYEVRVNGHFIFDFSHTVFS